MGILDNLGRFSIGGSINTQFATELALERVAIASGEKVGNLASFLLTLEFIGYILLILLSVFIITAFGIIYSVLFLCWVYRKLFPTKKQKEEYAKAKANGEFMSDAELERELGKFELTDEDIEEINNYN